MTGKPNPRVVIIGGGFAGLSAAKALAGERVDITLLDRTNHHTFQPLLYEVATAVLAPSEIASPIRWLLRKQRNVTVLLAKVDRVDPARRVVIADDGAMEVPYDYLIVATGARHAYFGRPEWERFAPGLKSLEDAREIRRRFLLAFEEAEKCADPAEREAWLTIVIVGAGPTGVELAGVIPEVARRGIVDDFRRIDTRKTRVILLEGGPRVLPSFPPELSERARQDLTELGVDVRTGTLVTGIDADGVQIGGQRIPTHTVLWAAGNAGSPLARSLDAPLDPVGRVKVARDLSVPGHPEIFVAGDLAAFPLSDNRLVPGVAPAANQEGRHAAKNILRTIREDPTEPFVYHDKGNLATIGRHRAVAEFGSLHVSGAFAWLLWLFVHILYLAGFRNRVVVAIEWGYAYFTFHRGARVITARHEDPPVG
jgi:NADH dehydrogenase